MTDRRPPVLGLRTNLAQFSLLVGVNALVGGMVGQERTVLPLLADHEFHLTAYTATLSDGAKFLGSVSLSGGTVQVAQLAILTLSGNNSMSGGTLGGIGTVKFASGTLTWSGGTMTGAGPSTLAVGATIKQTGAVTIQNSRLLVIAGTFDDTVDATFFGGGPAPLIHVLAGGLFKKIGRASCRERV